MRDIKIYVYSSPGQHKEPFNLSGGPLIDVYEMIAAYEDREFRHSISSSRIISIQV